MTEAGGSPPARLLGKLQELGIDYRRVDHPAVYTVDQAREVVPPLPGTNAKNLFLRNKSGSRHILLVVGYDTRVDLQGLACALGEKRLSMASAERLHRYLGVELGAVSLLAVVNDDEHAVDVLVDRALWDAETIKCHPLVNTSTMALSRTDLEGLLTATGHSVTIIDVPVR